MPRQWRNQDSYLSDGWNVLDVSLALMASLQFLLRWQELLDTEADGDAGEAEHSTNGFAAQTLMSVCGLLLWARLLWYFTLLPVRGYVASRLPQCCFCFGDVLVYRFYTVYGFSRCRSVGRSPPICVSRALPHSL